MMRVPSFLSWRRLYWRTGHSLAGPYALDALEAAERARFERHLRRCATCLAEVRGFAAVAASLGLAAAVTPPPGLKGRVLADVEALDAARSADAEIAAVLSAADARVASGATSAGGTATVVASRRDGNVVFTSSGLPVLPPSSVYELWFIGSAGVRPAGLVPAPDPAGAAVVLVLASGLSPDDAIGVTVEPAGGTAAPTTTPIVVLTLR